MKTLPQTLKQSMLLAGIIYFGTLFGATAQSTANNRNENSPEASVKVQCSLTSKQQVKILWDNPYKERIHTTITDKRGNLVYDNVSTSATQRLALSLPAYNNYNVTVKCRKQTFNYGVTSERPQITYQLKDMNQNTFSEPISELRQRNK